MVSMTTNVRVGVEWTNRFHQDAEDENCRSPDLRYMDAHAEGFFLSMRDLFGHEGIFNWGDDNAWSTDFDHPDFGGDSLNWSDNVHFCFFAGHGSKFDFNENGFKVAYNIGFPLKKPPDWAPCRSLSPQWRLGAGKLKWFVLDSCQMTVDTDPNHIVEAWGPPMQGIHLLFGFIDLQWVNASSWHKRLSFAFDICRGEALANAWLDTAYGWENPNEPTRPIVIAAGVSRDDAINRRENETLDWLHFDVASTNWLAWKWRG